MAHRSHIGGGQNVINVTIPHLKPTQPQEGVWAVPLISAYYLSNCMCYLYNNI